MTEIAPADHRDSSACIFCGYNLYGLDESGHCPECGQSISRSVRGDFLRFTDPAWLQIVKRGVDLMFWSVLLGLLLGFVILLPMAVLNLPDVFIVALLLHVAFSIAFLISILRITTREPEPGSALMSEGWRMTSRVAAVILYAGQMVGVLIGLSVPEDEAVQDTLGGLGGVANLVLTFALLSYARGLALRIPDEKLARHTKIVKWGQLALIGLLITMVLFAGLAGAFARPAGGGGGAPTGAAIGIVIGSCVFLIAALVLAVWLVRILLKFRKELSRIIPEARAHAGAVD